MIYQHLRQNIVRVFLALGVLAVCAVLTTAAPITLTVDPCTTYAVSGVSAIQPVRSMVVNGSSAGKRVDMAQALRMPGTRLYLWVDFGATDEPKQLSNYNLGQTDRLDWLLSHDMDTFVHAQFDRNLGIDPATGKPDPKLQNPSFISVQYLQLGYLERWGATGNVTLHVIQPHPRSEADFAPYARYYHAVLHEVTTRFPSLQVRYLMLYNEPNISYLPRSEKRNRADRIKLLYGLYSYVESYIRKDFPSVSLVGPSLSQFHTWSDWDDWTVPFLIQEPNATCFGAQIYSSRFDEMLAWNEMLQAKSFALNRHRMPMAITEWNPQSLDGGPLPGGAEYWKDTNEVFRVALLSDALFGMMENPDKFAFASYFFYDCGHDGYDLLQSHDGQIEPTAGYWFYRTIHDINGVRVYAGQDTDTSPIHAIASVDGQRLVVAIYNSAKTATAINLSVLNVTPSRFTRIERTSLSYDPIAAKFVFSSDATLEAWPKAVTLPGGGIEVLSSELPAGTRRSAKIDETEVFASETGLNVMSDPVTVELPALEATKSTQIALRFGAYSDSVQTVNRFDVNLNGHAISVPFAPDCREKRPRTCLQADVAVPTSWVGSHNRLVFFPNSGGQYRVMSASLVSRLRPARAPALRSLASMTDATALFGVVADMPRESSPGETRLRVKVTNRADKPQFYSLSVTLPVGWRLMESLPKLEVPANGSKTPDIRVVVPYDQKRGSVSVVVTVRAPNSEPQSATSWTTYQPRLVACRVQGPVQLEGLTACWPGTSVVIDHPALANGEPYRTETWLAWDESRFYVMVKVTGRPLMTVPVGKLPWGRDTLEAFFDFANAKNQTRDLRTLQTVVMVQRDETGKPDWYDAPTNASGESLPTVKPTSYSVHVDSLADGFLVRTSFDWASLDSSSSLPLDRRFSPSLGQRIGFELSLAGESLIGGGNATGAWSNPREWGTLVFDGGIRAANRD